MSRPIGEYLRGSLDYYAKSMQEEEKNNRLLTAKSSIGNAGKLVMEIPVHV